MRAYQFLADDETRDALRRLAAPWAGYTVADAQVEIRLRAGDVIRIFAEQRSLEPGLDCARLYASIVGQHRLTTLDSEFPAGVRGIMLLASEVWLEDAGRRRARSAMGAPGTHPDSASAVCTVVDAVWLCGRAGRQLVVGCEPASAGLHVWRSDEAIAEVCASRRGIPLPVQRA